MLLFKFINLSSLLFFIFVEIKNLVCCCEDTLICKDVFVRLIIIVYVSKSASSTSKVGFLNLIFLYLSEIFLAAIHALFLEVTSLISSTTSMFLFLLNFLYLSLIFLAAIPADLVYFLRGFSSITSIPFIQASFLAFSLLNLSYFLDIFLAA